MKKRSILLIEDDPGIQAVTKFSLEMKDSWQVYAAISGLEGLNEARKIDPDVILLDIVMPDINGLDLLKQLKNDPLTSQIPVILFTAKLIANQLDDLTNKNVAGIITKPFDCLTLAKRISDILGWQYGLAIYFTHQTLGNLANTG